VVKCIGLGFVWCIGLAFVWCSGLTLGVILYIYYIILFSSLLLFLSFIFLSSIPLPIFHPDLFPIFILYLSVLTYTYLYSLQIFLLFPPTFSLPLRLSPYLLSFPYHIHSILVGTYIYLFISHPIFYSLPLLFPILFLFLFSFPNTPLPIISSNQYLSVLTYTYLYSFHFNPRPTI
jgi:hypothetical protein